jgi:hypothetical protein
MRVVIDARHNPHNPHDLFHQLGASRGGRDHCQSCLGNFRNGSMLSKKSFGGNKRNFLKLLMRFVRSDVRDHIVSLKNDHGPSYRHYRASQRRSSICEIFGVVRFSTFSTASTPSRRQPSQNLAVQQSSPGVSDFHLFRYRERIIHLDA